MIKIMMKVNFIKDIATWAPNDTQHQDNSHPKKSYSVMGCYWPMQNVALYLYQYHDIENAEL